MGSRSIEVQGKGNRSPRLKGARMEIEKILLVSLELNALGCEREAMKIANVIREDQGYSPAYGEEAFFDLSDKFRALKLECDFPEGG